MMFVVITVVGHVARDNSAVCGSIMYRMQKVTSMHALNNAMCDLLPRPEDG
jgi:hypothetical protein